MYFYDFKKYLQDVKGMQNKQALKTVLFIFLTQLSIATIDNELGTSCRYLNQ